MIKQIASDKELNDSVEVIRQSFTTVADEFGLTQVNCPTHPSFITFDNLAALRERGLFLFGLFDRGIQIGFIGVEKSGDGLYFIEKLSVMPGFRHHSNGTKLVRFAFDFITKNGGKKVSIGIIDGHAVLKQWYRGLGFCEVNTKKFDHLPFTVCFMEKTL